MQVIGYLILGLVAGAFSGLVGLGGGIILIPALVYIFGLSQQSAQGTTLALMVPPIGILAAYTYYKSGYVDLKVAALICCGFLFGGLFGAKLGVVINQFLLKKIFAVSLLIFAVKMLLEKKPN